MSQIFRRAVLALAVSAMPGCSPDFDGLYRVESYALVEGDCTGAGTEIEREFSEFRIRERMFAGVTVYPLYPCDGSGNCANDNHGAWNVVTTAADSHNVSMTVTYNFEDSCVLSSIELLIGEHGDPEGGAVLLERRVSEVAVEPYVADECTTDRAKSMRDRMQCVQVLRIIGELERVAPAM